MKNNSWKPYAIITVLIFVLAYITWSWYTEKNKPPVSTVEYINVEKIKTVEKIKKVEVPIEKIITIEKVVFVDKITGLPDWFTSNPDEQAVASARIAPYKGYTDAIATMNVKTGKGNIIAKQEPLSFIGFSKNRRFYGKVGYSTNSELQVGLGGEQYLLRIGNVEIGGFVEGKAYFEANNTLRDNIELVGGVVIAF
jgi:hypothetical protein